MKDICQSRTNPMDHLMRHYFIAQCSEQAAIML